MKYLKSAEEFNESFLGLGKSNKEKVQKEYEKLLGEIKTKFSDDAMKTIKPDDVKTMANYITKLDKIGKLNDFKSTKDGEKFIKTFRGLNTMKTVRSKVEFNESVISKFKDFFTKDKKDEVVKTPEEKYKELVGLIIDFVYDKESEFHLSLETFNVCKEELKEIGKWEEFKNSVEYNDEFKNLLYKKLLLEITENLDNLRHLKDIFENCEKELKEIGKWEDFLKSDECKGFYAKCVDEITENFDDEGAFFAYSSCITKIGKWQEFINSEEGRKIQQMSPRKLKK